MLKLHAILVIALASSACADTPHGGTTDGSSTPLGSAPENHTHSLPGAASTMRLSAKNRVVPAYPRVRWKRLSGKGSLSLPYRTVFTY